MDVLELIDKLDDLIHNARAVPLTDQVRIDREAIYDLLDQMRSTIPEEVKQARWIVKERQEMLAEAKREAERLVADARDKAAQEASEQEVVKRAEREAADILEEARQREREVRLGRRGLRRRGARHARGQPRQVPPGRPARARAPPGPRGRAARRGARSPPSSPL